MKLIGNTSTQIDWDQIIANLRVRTGNSLEYNTKSFNPSIPGFSELDKLWQEAGYLYNSPSIKWTNFFPGEDFDQEIVDIFSKIVDTKPWMVWISRISPGQMAPWHFDAHTKLEEIKNLGNPVRFTCYIQEPQHGHISIVGNEAVYRPEKGSIYQWPSYDAWHCGMNGGVVDKYMFNYWGYQ